MLPTYVSQPVFICLYIHILSIVIISASHLVLRMLKICLPMQETQETWIKPLGGEDHLEEEMATHSSILAWKIPQTDEPGRASVHVVAKSWTQLSD